MIEAERVTLAPFSFGDIGFWLHLARNAETRAFLGGPKPVRALRRDVCRDLRGAQTGYVWTVKWDGRRIGLLHLPRVAPEPVFELSYQFRADAWGRGLAYEACSALLQWRRQSTTDLRIVAETQTANARSIGLLRRLRFEETARLERFGAEQSRFEWHDGVD